MPTDSEFTRILDWPGYRVYQHQIDEKAKTLKLWIRRKRGKRKIECSGCGRKFTEIYDLNERPGLVADSRGERVRRGTLGTGVISALAGDGAARFDG